MEVRQPAFLEAWQQEWLEESAVHAGVHGICPNITVGPHRAHDIMKSSDGTDFRFCKPKYQPIWSSLVFVGCVLIVGIRYVFPKAPEWISEIGLLMSIAGLVVFVFGTIAARREWEAKRKTETK